MKTSTIGWDIKNGSGWNNHITAKSLAEKVGFLPDLPEGYIALVAPIDPDRPLGLRCMLAKELGRVVDDTGLDDGPDGVPNEWAWNAFRLDVERIYSCKVDSQTEDSSEFFIKKISEVISKLN